MKKIIKRYLSTFGLTLIILTLLSQNAFALQNLGEFSYWYSDNSSIGYMASSSVKVACALSTNCQMLLHSTIKYVEKVII